jgi:hypothetical protein
MQATGFLEAMELIWAYQTTRRHIPLYRNLVLLGIQKAQQLLGRFPPLFEILCVVFLMDDYIITFIKVTQCELWSLCTEI